jgi:hypothetical protein
LTIHDDLYRQVRQIAAAEGSTVGSVIEQAISLLLARHEAVESVQADAFPDLPAYSGGGLQPGVDLDNNASMSDLLDEGVALHALR